VVEACNQEGTWSERPAIFAFSISPHFYETWLFYGLCGVAVVGMTAGIQSYRLHWQRRLLRLEHQQSLAEERARIARDLHDELGTALTGLALELDVRQREAEATPKLGRRLGGTAARTRALAERMREVVWAINPRCDTVSSLASFLEQQAGHLLQATDLRGRIEFPDDIPPMPLDSDTRHQLALGVREALTNVVRHARATEVVLGLSIQHGQLSVRVADNGIGCVLTFLTQSPRGLANLRERMAQLGGRLECATTPGQGTTLTFRGPLPTQKPRSEDSV
jgi:signal transduction histidine kinase